MNKKTLYIQILCALAIIVPLIIILTSQSNHIPSDADYKQTFKDSYRLYSPPIPDSLDFCGEQVPLDRYDVREALDRELLVNVSWQSNILLDCKRANRFFPMIEEILKENKVPEDFKYLAVIESNLTNVVSPAKAAGFWQFIKTTGITYGLEINDEVDQRYDVRLATLAACKYLKNSYRLTGSWTSAAAAYNMGDNGFLNALSKQKTDNYWNVLLNSETARYVYRILAMKIIMNDVQQYGIYLRHVDLYQPLEVEYVSVDTAIGSLTDFAISQGITYKQLKDYNPWLRSTKLTNASHITYQIAIPKKESTSYSKQIEGISKNTLLEKL